MRNAEKDLQRCLNLLRQQRLPKGVKLEIVVVDNESSDKSAQVAREYGAKVVFLPVVEFSWGRALNRGIAASYGDIILLLSADAYPANNSWIIEMAAPLNDPNVAAVYGRQIPCSDAPIDEIVRLKNYFKESDQIAKKIPENFSRIGGDFPISNACAVIRRKVWEEISYDEVIDGGEEGIWTYMVLRAGYFVVYRSTAIVYHSHNDPFFRGAWRNLELLKKNTELTGGRLNLFSYFRFICSKIKRRIFNLFFPGLSFSIRFRGIIILPLEILSIFIVAVFFLIDKRNSHYRSMFWN